VRPATAVRIASPPGWRRAAQFTPQAGDGRRSRIAACLAMEGLAAARPARYLGGSGKRLLHPGLGRAPRALDATSVVVGPSMTRPRRRGNRSTARSKPSTARWGLGGMYCSRSWSASRSPARAATLAAGRPGHGGHHRVRAPALSQRPRPASSERPRSGSGSYQAIRHTRRLCFAHRVRHAFFAIWSRPCSARTSRPSEPVVGASRRVMRPPGRGPPRRARAEHG